MTSFDEAVDALSDVQRRKLLVSLLAHNPQDDSPVAVADAEQDETMLESIVRMEHVHLPKLEESGYIEWDRESHEVMKGPDFDEIRPLLELLDAHADELPEGYLPADAD